MFLGRVHLYEGHAPATVVHGVRTAVAAGCQVVVLTNAAGGIREGYQVGQPVLIRDHLNLTGRSPLGGPPPPEGYPSRFTDLTDLYSARLRTLAAGGAGAGEGLAEGVYAALPGPHYETPAEIRMLRTLGADLVGMSTVLEAIAARHLGAEVLAISLVSNLAAGLAPHGPRPRGGGRRGQGGGGQDGIAAGRAAARDRAGRRRATVIGGDLRAQAERWIAGDPDERDRAELRGLLADGGEAAAAELAGQVRRPAGVRHRGPARRDRSRPEPDEPGGGAGDHGRAGRVAAGRPRRRPPALQRAPRRRRRHGGPCRRHGGRAGATGGPGAAEAGVVIGCDARHRSGEFADEAARVLAGAGIRAHLLPPQQPTPLLAFAVRHLRAAAGIMITASHNPPADNGYKLYLGDGAQIIPPVDKQIGTAIAELGDLCRGPGRTRGQPADRQARRRGGRCVPGRHRWRHPPPSGGLPTARSLRDPGPGSLRGPGPGSLRDPGSRASQRPPGPPCGWCTRRCMASRPAWRCGRSSGPASRRRTWSPLQAEPDPAFPTVAFPNPEEPGALDLALALAREIGADLVIANDPDGDRLAVAVPDPAAPGGWRALSGDQVGALLGSYLLDTDPGPDPAARLAATTVVSATMLSKIAAAAGVHYARDAHRVQVDRPGSGRRARLAVRVRV